MPPKRRAAAVESDSEGGSSQASKRARTLGDNDVEVEDAPQPSGSGTRGTQQRANEPIDVDEEDEDMGHAAPDEDDEKRFEEEHEEEIRRKVIGGHKGQGVSGRATRKIDLKLTKSQQNIAETGIIEKLELFSFMCHKYLVFTFGPQINFIIGGLAWPLSHYLRALTRLVDCRPQRQ